MLIRQTVRPTQAPRVIAKPSDDALILLNVDSGEYYTLNESGATIWNLCDGNRDVAGITSEISILYDVAMDEAETDVEEILEQLANEALISLEFS